MIHYGSGIVSDTGERPKNPKPPPKAPTGPSAEEKLFEKFTKLKDAGFTEEQALRLLGSPSNYSPPSRYGHPGFTWTYAAQYPYSQ